MKVPARARPVVAIVQSLASNVRAELDAAHERLGVDADLGGACAFATVAFERAVGFYNAWARKSPAPRLILQRPLVVYGWFRQSPRIATQHCWAEIGTVIVDITATQFGYYPRARLCPRTNPRYESIDGTGSDAMRSMKYFNPSPRKRRALLTSLARRAAQATIEDFA